MKKTLFLDNNGNISKSKIITILLSVILGYIHNEYGIDFSGLSF